MRSKRIFSILMLLFTIFLFAGKSFAEMPQIPDPIGDIYVQDFAGVLTEQEKIEVGRIGSNVEEKTTAQISVLTVESIGDQSIEEFANEVFRQYKIGNEEEDNGILMVIGMNPSSGSDERPLRIEVGYGLEGRLPDGKVGRILDEITIPYLQKNEINRAIIETYKVLASEVLAEYVIEGEKQQVEQPTQELREDEGIGIPSWLLIIIVVVVFI